MKKLEGGWKTINYFTGFLECIVPRRNSNFDIIFKSKTDKGNVSLLLKDDGRHYMVDSIVAFEGLSVIEEQNLKANFKSKLQACIGKNEY